MHKHIAVLLMMAIFSLITHVGVYHIPYTDSDHTQKEDHGHTDSDTCIAGLIHVQLSLEQSAPPISWLLIGFLSSLIEKTRQYGIELLHTGRAPPSVSTAITA
jgi:hypothetical protein